MSSPPSLFSRLLARTAIPSIYADVRAYLSETSGKTFAGLLLCPLLITFTMRLGTIPHAEEALTSFWPGKHDQLYAWYSVFAFQITLLFMIPMLCIKLGFREPLSEFGFQLRPLFRLWPLLLLFLAIMLPITYQSSRNPAFATYYPLYRGSLESWEKFLLFEGGLFLVFVTQEFFFRGFLIEALKPKFGMNAILIASAMYGIAHYTKPLPEQLGAFFVGIVLGYIGDRYRTFFFGVVIHYLIALSMDAFLVVPALLAK